MDESKVSVSNTRLVEKLETVIIGQLKIEEAIKALREDYQGFRERYIEAHVKLEEKANSAHWRLDQLEKDFEKLDATVKQSEKNIEQLTIQIQTVNGQIKSVLKIAGILAASMIGLVGTLLWEILTHRITLLVP